MAEAEPVTVITGASAGIGAALAHVFADHGHALVLVARRAAQLKVLADTIEERGRTRPHVIVADLALRDAAARIEDELRDNGLDPQFLNMRALIHDWIALGAIMDDTDRRFVGDFESIR